MNSKYFILCMFFVTLTRTYGSGIINTQTVVPEEKQATIEVIRKKKKEILKEIDLYEKELLRHGKCLIEKIRGVLAQKMLLEYSLLERKAILKQVEDKKRIQLLSSIETKEK